MFITLKKHYQIIEKYEKRIDDLLDRVMSANFSEYKFVKETKIPAVSNEDMEILSRTDEDEYLIEQKRLNDLKELEDRADKIKEEILKT